MRAGKMMILITDATDEGAIGRTRHLFRSYGAEFADSSADVLCLQGFEDEITGLPGKYAPPSGCLLLASAGNDPAGCVAMRDLGRGDCEMKRLYVAPVYRGLGIARRLVEEIVQRAEHAGYQRMVLDTLPEMGGAIALYRSLGFTECAPYRESSVERMIFFEKPLLT
jgi:ribosomal protein S18 acetylase RimI-like enzyme